MSGWLDSLPHQIPFRAASSGRILDEKTIEGEFLASGADSLVEGGELPGTIIFEAMAQLGGGLAFRDSSAPAFLSAIEEASLDAPLQQGDRIRLRVRLEASFGAIYRFRGTGEREGLEIARARFYLAEQSAQQES